MLTTTKLNEYPEILDPTLRSEFVVTLELSQGNPNGDPENGGQPRQTPSGHLLISDVKMKRCLRDYWEEQYGEDSLYIARAAAERKENLTSRSRGLHLQEPNEIRFTGASDITGQYMDVRLLGGLILAEGKKADAKKAKAAKKAKTPVPVEPLDDSDDSDEKDETAGNTAILGPFQIGHGISTAPVDVEALKITRMIAQTGKDADGNGKSRDLGDKFYVERATFKFEGRYASHIGVKKAGITPADMAAFWMGLVNGPGMRRSSTSGLVWVSNLKVWTYDQTGEPKLTEIKLVPPPSAVEMGLV